MDKRLSWRLKIFFEEILGLERERFIKKCMMYDLLDYSKKDFETLMVVKLL